MIIDPNLKYQLTMGQALFCLFFWLFIFYINYPQIYGLKKSGKSRRGMNYKTFFVFALIFSVFNFAVGDFPHYWQIYDTQIKYGVFFHMEPIFEWSVFHSFNNYFVWRTMIWGSALAVMLYAFKKAKCDARFTSLIFTLLLLFYFTAMRQSLGFALLYLGLVYFVNEEKKKINYLIGLSLMGLSLFFHKSMPLYLIIVAFGIVSIYFGRFFYIVSFILFPILYGFLFFLADWFLSNFLDVDQFSNTGLRFLKQSGYELNILGYFRLFLQSISIVLLYAFAIKSIWFDSVKSSKIEKITLNIAYVLSYISLLFLGQNFAESLFLRFWNAAYYVFALFLATFLYRQKRSLFLKITLWGLIFIALYDLLYVIYSLSIGRTYEPLELIF